VCPYTCAMSATASRPPLLLWDLSVLRFDLDAVQFVLNQQLEARRSSLRDLRIEGVADVLTLRGVLRVKGMPTPIAARLTDLRLYRRFLGCRVQNFHGPLGLPLPLALLESLLGRHTGASIGFSADDAILTVDLRNTLPPGLRLEVLEVRCRGRQLAVTLAPGSWTASTRDVLLSANTQPC
jgi:hypothetical protein